MPISFRTTSRPPATTMSRTMARVRPEIGTPGAARGPYVPTRPVAMPARAKVTEANPTTEIAVAARCSQRSGIGQ